MTNRALKEIVVAAAFVLGAVRLASVSPLAQALQKAMYVSVVDEAGAPVPDLGPSDFIVREDDVAREVLNVVPAVLEAPRLTAKRLQENNPGVDLALA